MDDDPHGDRWLPSGNGSEWHYTDIGIDRSPTETVVSAVAAVGDRSPHDLPTLYDRIDADALDALVRHAARRRTRLVVSFTYAGCAVVVRPGAVHVRALG